MYGFIHASGRSSACGRAHGRAAKCSGAAAPCLDPPALSPGLHSRRPIAVQPDQDRSHRIRRGGLALPPLRTVGADVGCPVPNRGRARRYRRRFLTILQISREGGVPKESRGRVASGFRAPPSKTAMQTAVRLALVAAMPARQEETRSTAAIVNPARSMTWMPNVLPQRRETVSDWTVKR